MIPQWHGLGPDPQISDRGVAVSGRVLCAIVSPDIDGLGSRALFLGIDGGGIWRSKLTPAGPLAWLPVSDGLAAPIELKPALQSITSLAISPPDPRTIYASAPGGVLRSIDGGTTWLLVSAQPGLSTLVPDPRESTRNQIWACGSGGVFVSRDAGATWLPSGAGLPLDCSVDDLALVASETLQLYAAVHDQNGSQTGFWTLPDGDSTWHLMDAAFEDHVTGQPTTADYMGTTRMATNLYGAATTGIYAVIAKRDPASTALSVPGDMLDVMRLAPGDSTWRSASGQADAGGLPATAIWFQRGENMPICVSDTGAVVLGSSKLLTTGGPGVFRTLDGGVHWAQITGGDHGSEPHLDGHALTTFGDTVFYGNDGGIFRFDPLPSGSVGQGTWTSLNTAGLSTHLLYGISLHPTNPFSALVGSQDNGTALWSGSAPWTFVTGGDSGLVRFDPDPAGVGKYAYAVQPPEPDHTVTPAMAGFFYRSASQGAAPWEERDSGIDPDAVPIPWFTAFAIHPHQTQRLLVGLNKVYETRDHGDHWAPISDVLPDDPHADADAIAYGGDDGTVYVAYGSRLFVTVDSGGMWSSVGKRPVIGASGFGPITGITAGFEAPWTAYVVCENGTVWRTSDRGGSWTDLTANLPHLSLHSVAAGGTAPDHAPLLFVGTSVGVYAAVDHGASTSWARYGSGLPEVKVTDLQIAPGRNEIAAATWGRGAFINVIGEEYIPQVQVIEQVDDCKVGTVAGSRGRYCASTAYFSSGALEYKWHAENAAVIGRDDLRCVTIQAPATGQFVVSVNITDAEGNEASGRKVAVGMNPGEARWAWWNCRFQRRLKSNWPIFPGDPAEQRARLEHTLRDLEAAAEEVRSVLGQLPQV